MTTASTFSCPTCGQCRSVTHRVRGEHLRDAILACLRTDYPAWDGQYTCREDLQRARLQVMRQLTERHRGEVAKLDASALERMAKRELSTLEANGGKPNLSSRMADRIAAFGGSWTFLGSFGFLLLAWMVTNVLVKEPPDPYPFILLNLLLSCLAATQAPIIMMSQNRAAEKDRQRAAHDFEVNLKAELELRLLHDKLDHLLMVEWQQLLDIQATQTEMLEELSTAAPHSRAPANSSVG